MIWEDGRRKGKTERIEIVDGEPKKVDDITSSPNVTSGESVTTNIVDGAPVSDSSNGNTPMMKEVTITAKAPEKTAPASQTPSYAMDGATKAKLDNEHATNVFLQEHPWVVADNPSDMYKQYRDLSGNQYLQDLWKYQQMTGQQPSISDVTRILQGRDPNKTENDIRKENRRLQWKENINNIGDFLANFVNFGRAMGGNPIADIKRTDNSQIERLRAAQQNLDRQHYMDYVNSINDQYKQQQAVSAKEREYQQKMAMEQAKQNTPEALLQQELLKSRLSEQEQKAVTAKYKSIVAQKQAEGYDKKEADEAALRAINIELKRSQIRKNDRSGTNTSKNNDDDNKPYGFVDKKGKRHGYNSKEAAYKEACREYGEEPLGHPNDTDYENVHVYTNK